MTERQAKIHFLENVSLASILEPEEFTSRPAECKGKPSSAVTKALRIQITRKGAYTCAELLYAEGLRQHSKYL